MTICWDSLTTTWVELHLCPIHEFLLLSQGPFTEILVKKYSELVDLKNWLFLKKTNSIIQSLKKFDFFLTFQFKCSTNSWVALQWLDSIFMITMISSKKKGGIDLCYTLYIIHIVSSQYQYNCLFLYFLSVQSCRFFCCKFWALIFLIYLMLKLPLLWKPICWKRSPL